MQTEEEVNWLSNHILRHNWMADSVYIDALEASLYGEAVQRLQQTGLVLPGVAVPEVSIHVLPEDLGRGQT